MPVRSLGISTALAGALALAGCGGGTQNVSGNAAAGEPTTFMGGFNKGFADKFKPSFTASCSKAAASKGTGVPVAKLEQVCGCAADDLAKKYNVTELMALTAEQAKPSVEACAKTAGLIER